MTLKRKTICFFSFSCPVFSFLFVLKMQTAYKEHNWEKLLIEFLRFIGVFTKFLDINLA